MRKENKGLLKRTGVMLLSISLMFSMLLSMGLAEYSYAETDEEKTAAAAEETEAPAASVGQKEEASAEEAKASDADAAEVSGEEAGEQASEVNSLEFVGFSEKDPLNLGTFEAGYTKNDAEKSREYITVKNTGNTTLSIDPSRLRISDQKAFYFMGEGDSFELEPEKTRVVGWVQPRHQMTAGTYAAGVSIFADGYIFAYGTVGYHVKSRSCEIEVLDYDEYEIESVEMKSVVKNNISLRSERLWLVNYSSDYVDYEISSDNKLFDVEFEDDSETGGDPLDMTGIIVSLNKRRAESLDAGTYTGNIKVKAALKGSTKTAEVRLPVSIVITEEPRWKDKAGKSWTTDQLSEYFVERVEILNTEAFGDDVNRYLRAEISDGSEYFKFDSEINSEGKIKLCTTGHLEPGIYTAALDLYYDSEGNGGKGKLFDSAAFRLEVVNGKTYDEDYKLEIVNAEIQKDTFDLGVLAKGYSAETAKERSVQLKIKNTGKKDVTLSPGSLKPDFAYEADDFVISSSSDKSVVLHPGQVYDGISVRPKEGRDVGSYTMSAEIADEDNKTDCDVYFDYYVGNEGMNLTLEKRKDLFSPWEIIRNEGLDFGKVDPDQEQSEIKKYIRFTNDGTVPLKVSVSIEGDTKGAFKIKPVWEGEVDMNPGYYTVPTVICDPSKLDTQGAYTASMKVSCKAEGGQTVERNVPLRITKAKTNVYKVTLDFQNKGGYANRVVEATEGTPYNDVITQIMSEVMNVKYDTIPWPTDDEYSMIAITKKKDSELTSWEDAKIYTNEVRKGTVTGDTTIYINWGKKIDKAELNVTAPECGDATSAAPVITLGEDVKFSVTDKKWNVSEGETRFEGDRDYAMEAVLRPDFGWAFPADLDIMVNGKHVAREPQNNDPSSLTVSTTLKAEHDTGDWTPAGEKEHVATCSKCHNRVYEEHCWDEGEETTSPTCYKPGEMTYTCLVCGYKKYEEIPQLDHKFRFTVIRETTGDKTGYMNCECTNCGDDFEDQFYYDCTGGNGETYYRDSKYKPVFVFKRNNMLGKDFIPNPSFKGIVLDGTEYPYTDRDRYWAVTYGKTDTELRFRDSLWNSLADGEHTLKMLYGDGESGTIKFKIAKPKMISEVDMTIGAPVCGDSASSSFSPRTGEVIVNPPVVTLAGGAAYHIDESTYWTDSSMKSYWSGTFKGGETSYAYVSLAPEDGSLFSKDGETFKGTVKVNGREVTPLRTRMDYNSNAMRFWIPVEAVHVWDEGKVTKEPTAEAEGVMTFTCTKCGETKGVSISNEKEKEAARRAAALADGAEHTLPAGTFRITSSAGRTAAFVRANGGSATATIPATINVEGIEFAVTSIGADAFRGTTVKTIIVETKSLTKASVRGSLKGSKVKTVKVRVGKKKENKKYVKKYKKIFTKKNCGRKVRVKR